MAHRLLGVAPGELAPALLCTAQFFFVLFSAFVMRPMREAAGIQGGVEQLPVLFLATMLAMLLINPLFAVLVATMRRARFIPLTYHLFTLNILAFAALFALASDAWRPDLGRVFYVWMSVFNLFAVSVFWILMVDVWGSQMRGERLFGLLGVGGTLGAIAGSLTTNLLANAIDQWLLFIVSAVALQLAGLCASLILRAANLGLTQKPARSTGVVGASVLDPGAEPGPAVFKGLWLILRSPYLLAIAAYVLLLTILSTIAYFVQGSIVAANFASRAQQTEFFALLDVVAQGVTLLVQLFLTSRIIRAIGIGWALAILPILSLAGFLALGITINAAGERALASTTVLWTFFVFQVVRRGTNYALAKPSREILFTVTTQSEKYGAKPIIDTFVYRAGDAVGALAYPALTTGLVAPFALAGIGLSAAAASLWMTPLSALWLVLALALGVRARQESQPRPSPPPT